MIGNNGFCLRIKIIAIISSCTLIVVGCQTSSGPPEISIEDVWSRPVVVNQSSLKKKVQDKKIRRMDYSGVVYLTIKNRGGSDRLLRATSGICKAVEIHETKTEDGRMTMQMVKDGLEIPGNDAVKFTPGGHHIMLIGLKKSLNVGERFTVLLEFEKSGTKSIESEIRQY